MSLCIWNFLHRKDETVSSRAVFLQSCCRDSDGVPPLGFHSELSSNGIHNGVYAPGEAVYAGSPCLPAVLLSNHEMEEWSQPVSGKSSKLDRISLMYQMHRQTCSTISQVKTKVLRHIWYWNIRLKKSLIIFITLRWRFPTKRNAKWLLSFFLFWFCGSLSTNSKIRCIGCWLMRHLKNSVTGATKCKLYVISVQRLMMAPDVQLAHKWVDSHIRPTTHLQSMYLVKVSHDVKVMATVTCDWKSNPVFQQRRWSSKTKRW